MNEILEKINVVYPGGMADVEEAIALRISALQIELSAHQYETHHRIAISDEKYLENSLALRLLIRGLDALSRLKRGWDIDPSDETGLEAIIEERLPFLVIENGTFKLPENWNWLQPEVAKMSQSINSVGRIQQKGQKIYEGTGFLVADDIVMTNWHVVRELVYQKNDNYKFYPHVQLSINFMVEYPRAGNSSHIITDCLFRHPQYDLALLKIEPRENVPLALKLSEIPVENSNGVPVYVIGHPYTDSRHGADSLVQLRLMLMGKTLGYKHLNLGYLQKLENYAPDDVLEYPEMPYLSHIVSTLPGNSGSCVIDTNTHKVIGLHCAGDNQKKKNYAVPIWQIQHSLRKYNLNFK